MQRVPVRIVLDPQIVKKYPLRLGLSMRVTVDLHNTEGERLSLIPSIRPIYQTNIYHKQQEGIEEIIEQIIEENLQEGISL
ncbi:MAG: hypothetical protein HYZ47_01335 [Simkania negevensis]|nr:hypothetical protein [Simkania negevensis]